MLSNEFITNVLEKAEIVLNLGNRTGIEGQIIECRYYNKAFYGVLKENGIALKVKQTGIYAVPTYLFPQIKDKEFFDYSTLTKLRYSKEIQKLVDNKKNSLGKNIVMIQCDLNNKDRHTYVEKENINKVEVVNNFIILHLENGSLIRISMLNNSVGVRYEEDMYKGKVIVFCSKIEEENWCVLRMVIN